MKITLCEYVQLTFFTIMLVVGLWLIVTGLTKSYREGAPARCYESALHVEASLKSGEISCSSKAAVIEIKDAWAICRCPKLPAAED